jgi:hypothetical protein
MKNNLSHWIAATLCAAFTLTATLNPIAHAAETIPGASPGAAPGKAASAPTRKATVHPYPFRGTVEGLDTTGRTIRLGGKKADRKLYVTEDSVLEKDGKPAKLEEIARGDYAKGLVTRPDGAREIVVKATFGPKPEKPGRDTDDAAANR